MLSNKHWIWSALRAIDEKWARYMSQFCSPQIWEAHANCSGLLSTRAVMLVEDCKRPPGPIRAFHKKACMTLVLSLSGSGPEMLNRRCLCCWLCHCKWGISMNGVLGYLESPKQIWIFTLQFCFNMVIACYMRTSVVFVEEPSWQRHARLIAMLFTNAQSALSTLYFT